MRRSKYGAVRTEADGITFASKREAKRYQELRLLEKAGEIRNLTLQPRYPLHVSIVAGGLVQVATYVGDFEYQERQPGLWRQITEDAKGMKTPVYRLKKKMFEAEYQREIREV